METEQPSPLGSLLLSTRKRANLTQAMLAERAAVSVNTISNLEAGRAHLPRQATLTLLVSALASELALAPSEQASFRAAFREATFAARIQGHTGDTERPAARREATELLPLPTGTLTFLVCAVVTGVETGVENPPNIGVGMLRLASLLLQCVPPRRGRLLDPPDAPDGAVSVFLRVSDALAAGCALQQALAGDETGPIGPVCLALHSGWAESGEGEYTGPTRRRAMRLARLGHGGQLLLSQPSRDLARRTIPEGVRLREAGRHSLCILERPQPIYQVIPLRTPPTTGLPLRLLQARPTNLPLQATNFIGREREQAAVSLLLAQAPLVTLIGAGGSGKTRLALQVAAELLEEYPDGVQLVELAGLSGTGPEALALVCQATADGVAVREERSRPLAVALVEALRPRRLLLVLDNCEHLIAACAELTAALLRGCPHLQILATSRERLAIRGETTYRVPPLSLPEPGRRATVEALAEYEGIRLFVERARAAHPAFTLTDANADAVVQVCRRLDGMPLPIELAAARAGGLPVETIAARLNQNFAMLTGGPRDVLPRHQTLRAALDWSWTLLSEQERILLRRLSVFAGGWRLGAAVAVCAGNGIADWAVPDLLEGLVGKSLAGLDERDGVVRYRLLETVRRYADERQTVAEDRVATRERHLAWCLALAEEAEEKFKEREQGDRPARLDREHDNLRAALAWSVGEKQNPTSGLRLAGTLWRFWLTHGHLAEGRRWLERALATADTAPIDLRASALAGAGNLAHRHGDFARAGQLHGQGLALYRELGDERGIAASLNGLGLVAWSLGDYGQAMAAFEECLSLWRGFEDRGGIATTLGNLGCVARSQGDYRRARELFEEALTLQRGLGHLLNSAIAMSNLGSILERQGDYERGAALYRESLALFQALDDTTGIAMALGNLGNPAHPSADFAQAKELLEESLSLFRGMEDLQGISGATAKLGLLAYRQGEYGRAEALYMESLNLARRVGEKEVICSTLIHLGRTLDRRGDAAQALSRYREALRSATEMGARNLIAYSLECIAAAVAALGDADHATQLLGAAERLRETIGIVLATDEFAEHEYVVRVVRASLGEEEFAAAWAEGQAMPLEQVATLARTAGSGH